MKTTLNFTGLDELMDTLNRLPENVVSKRGGPVKLALKKGAKLIRDAEVQRLQALLNEQGNNDTTGLLIKNIIASRGKKPANSRGERYVVRIKRRMYPSKANQKERVSTIKTAQIFEYGSEHQPARSFIRTAFLDTAEKAINVIRDDLTSRIQKLVRKYGLDTDQDNSLSM